MPLIDPRKRIALLQQQLDEIVTTTFNQPFGEYALYREAVGRYQGIMAAINELRKDLDDGDDDEV